MMVSAVRLYHVLRGGPPLAMGWRNLLFENYPVAPETVQPLVPDPLTLDTFEKQAWISVVPFRNVSIRPVGVPERFGIDLPELNLRTYVTYEGIRGVYFFSLDAQGVMSVVGARILHRLPYYYARIALERRDGEVHFRSRRYHPGAESARYRARYRPTGDPTLATRDELSDFLVERYRFYTVDRNKTVYTTEVEHDPWRLSEVHCELDVNTLLEASGLDTPAEAPVLFYSEGLDVRASGSQPA